MFFQLYLSLLHLCLQRSAYSHDGDDGDGDDGDDAYQDCFFAMVSNVVRGCPRPR